MIFAMFFIQKSPFEKIKNGIKTVELRLNDEKRQKIAVGDIIVFTHTETKETVSAKVVALHKFPDFEALYKALPLEKCGYAESELSTAHHTDMEEYIEAKKNIFKHVGKNFFFQKHKRELLLFLISSSSCILAL